MTTLNVQAVITAVDRLTGPLAAMGARVSGMQNRFNSAAAAASGFGMAAGMAAGGMIYALTAGQKELDAALRNFQVVGNATEKQRMQMRGMANDLGVHLGMPQLELIQGATEMLQAGLSTEDLFAKGKDGVTLLQTMGEAAKVAGQPIAEMATDLVTLAKSFNMPWGDPSQRAQALKDLMGLAIVAPRLSPDSATGHIRGLKEFGAIAAQLGITPREASALQNTLSSAGFRESLGGMGMKSILQRLLNPTTAAQAQMSANGFNFGRVFNNNLAGLTADKFVDAMETAGLDGAGARDVIAKSLQTAVSKGSSLDLLRFKGELSKNIAGKLGIKKGDAWNNKVVKTVVDDIIAGTGTGMNVTAFLEELQKLPVAAFKDVAGLHHASKMAVLRFQESLEQYKRNLKALDDQSGTAVGEGFRTKAEGWAYTLDRMGAAWEKFRNTMWDAGGAATWTGVVQNISSALEGLSALDPGQIKNLSGALNGIAVGLAAVAAASAGVWALARLGGMLTGPGGQLLALGGLAALAGVNMDGRSAQRGANGGIAGGERDSAGLLRSLAETSSAVMQLVQTMQQLAGVKLDLGGSMSVLGALKALIDDVNAGLQSLNKWMKGEGGTFGFGDGSFLGIKRNPEGGLLNAGRDYNAADANAPARGGTGFWETFKAGMMPGSGPNAALGQAGQQLQSAPVQVTVPPVKLEGSGTVTVNVKVEGPGQVTGVSASDDGKHIKLKTGGGMGDTNK